MSSRRASLRAFCAILVTGGGAVTGCAPATVTGVAVEDRVAVVSTVESVDQQGRDVLLRGPAGQLLTVKAGPEVRNLAQLRSGDRVRVTYRREIAAQLSPPGRPLPPATGESALIRAARGQRPAGAIYDSVRARVRIDAVDRGSGTVTFTTANRVTHTAVVRDPDMLAFVRQLQPGDEVDIDYYEALALSVEPAPS